MSAQIVSSSKLILVPKSLDNTRTLSLKSFKDSSNLQKGKLIVFSLDNNEGKTANTIKENYFSSQKPSLTEALKSSVNLFLGGGSAASNFLVVLVCEERINFIGWGECLIFLQRGSKSLKIFAGQEGKLGSCFGTTKSGDLFVLSLGKAKEDEIASSLVGDDPKEVIKRLSNLSEGAALLQIDKLEEVSESKDELRDQPEIQRHNIFKNTLIKIAAFLPERNPLQIKSSTPRSKKTAISVGILLLTILVISIFFGLKEKNNLAYKSSYDQDFLKANDLYNNSLAQKSVNLSEARELFSQAREILKDLDKKGIKDKRVEDLKNKVEGSMTDILGKVEAVPTVFLDLSLIREGVSAEEMGFDKSTLSILDKQGERIIQIEVSQKGTSVLGGSEKLSHPKTFISSQARYYVLGELGIISLTKTNENTTVIQKDDEWGEIGKMVMYGGSLYLLDKKGEIWRYASSGSGFSTKQAWLKDQVDLSNVSDMATDGYLWLLKDSNIVKLAKGSLDAFKIKGLEPGFSNPQSLYTDEALDSIFVLDQSNNRVVEMDKKGEYKKQYESEVIAEAVDLVVSKPVGKIFLLTRTRVLEMPLK